MVFMGVPIRVVYNFNAEIDKYYCNPAREAELYIRSRRLVPLDCIMGREEGSRDIDLVCYFVMR